MLERRQPWQPKNLDLTFAPLVETLAGVSAVVLALSAAAPVAAAADYCERDVAGCAAAAAADSSDFHHHHTEKQDDQDGPEDESEP